MDEPGGMRVGHRVGHLHCKIERSPHVQHASSHLGAKRLSLQELEDQEHAPVVIADIEQGDDVRVRQADQAARALHESGGIGGEGARQQANGDGAAAMGVARAVQLAGAGWVKTLEKVVVCDDAQWSGGVHVRRSSSMTLCTSSLASPICSSTMAISIAGRPGRRALWQYTPCWPTIASASVRRSKIGRAHV